MPSITDAFVAFCSKAFVYLFRVASSKPSLRALLKYVPFRVLMIGDRIAMRSFDQSLLNKPSQGSVGLIVQSGALELIVLNMMFREGIGLSKAISFDDVKKGNWNEAELLEELAKDPETDVIVFCSESIIQGREFMKIARAVTKMKPVIAFKSGKSEIGAKAVLSHVGSLAGSDLICSAAFRQSGVLRAQTIEEMLDFAKALSFQPRVKGPKVAIVTNGGGAGVIAADECIRLGLKIPDLPQSMQEYLERKLPLFSGMTNPLDIKFAATAETYADVLDCLFAFDGIDVILLMIYPSPALDTEKLVGALLKLKNRYEKPMIISAIGSAKFIGQLHKLEEIGIPIYLLPERASNGVAALVYYGQRCYPVSRHE